MPDSEDRTGRTVPYEVRLYFPDANLPPEGEFAGLRDAVVSGLARHYRGAVAVGDAEPRVEDAPGFAGERMVVFVLGMDADQPPFGLPVGMWRQFKLADRLRRTVRAAGWDACVGASTWRMD